MKLDKEGYPIVRRVTRKDREKLSELIAAFANKSGNKNLIEMVPGLAKEKEKEEEGKPEGDTSETIFELAKSVLQGALLWIKEDVTSYFMELVDAGSRDEYDSLPFDVEIIIIDQLLAQEGFNNFFVRVSDTFKKIRGYIQHLEK